MKNNKKAVLIGGGLLSPLEIGARATIQVFSGGFILTEPVQTILQNSSKHIKFETQDSIYHLLPQMASVCKLQPSQLIAA